MPNFLILYPFERSRELEKTEKTHIHIYIYINNCEKKVVSKSRADGIFLFSNILVTPIPCRVVALTL